MATTSDDMESPRKRMRLDTSEAYQSLGASTVSDPTTSSHDRSTLAIGGDNRQEHAVGITAFVSPTVPGFQCTIKHRYTDFLVNEILPDGHVLHLTNVNVHDHGEKLGRRNDRNGVSSDTAVSLSALNESEQSGQGAVQEQDSVEDRQTTDGTKQSYKKEQADQVEGADVEEPLDNASTAMLEPHDVPASTSKKERKEQIIAEVAESDKTTLQTIFGETTTTKVLDLYANIVTNPDRRPRDQPAVKSELISEKSKRTEAHVAIRRIFASKLETLTLQDQPGVMSIKAAPTKGPTGARGQPNAESSNGSYQKGKLGWDELGGEYLHFSLYKENKDTMEVLFFIAAQLKVQIKNFQFAGTKDRRGVTVQRVAIFRVHADKIARLNRSAKSWRAGNFEYKKHGLDLGELGGNEFLLTLRDCHFQGEEDLAYEERYALANEVVTTAAQSFRANGFLNYYGLQRFGTFKTGTHMLGQKMLQGDLEGTIDSILTYSDDLLPENQDSSGLSRVPQDDINRADAIRTWRNTGQSSEAVSKMPRRFQAETAIIQYLSKKDRKSGKLLQDRDWQGALMQIQRNLRLMYVHAYQSFVWNVVASKRWELHGNQVVEGDLVVVGEKDGDANDAKDEVDEDGEPIFHPAADDSAPSADDSFTRARCLTKVEAESGRYDIFDIVLPQPGYDVLYPANIVGKYYQEFMASEAGGGLDPHNMRRAWRDVSLSGGYRKVMARPGKDFEFEVKGYVGEEEQMVETDLERLRKAGYTENGDDNTRDNTKNGPGEFESQEKNRKIGIVLKMQLGSSQYATMALRELTKGGAVNFKPDYSTR